MMNRRKKDGADGVRHWAAAAGKHASKAIGFVIAATCLSAIAFVAGTLDADAVPRYAASHDLATDVVSAIRVAATGSAPQRLDENECPSTDTKVIGGQEVEGQLYDVDCIGIAIPFVFACESCTCKYMAEFNGYTWFWHKSEAGCDVGPPARPPIWIS